MQYMASAYLGHSQKLQQIAVRHEYNNKVTGCDRGARRVRLLEDEAFEYRCLSRIDESSGHAPQVETNRQLGEIAIGSKMSW